MTKKDYEAVASTLATVDGEAMTVASIACGLADVFARDNVRFDRDRFLTACGIGKGA